MLELNELENKTICIIALCKPIPRNSPKIQLFYEHVILINGIFFKEAKTKTIRSNL